MVQDLSIGLSGWSNRVWRSSGRSPYLGTRFKLTEYPELMSAAVALQKATAARPAPSATIGSVPPRGDKASVGHCDQQVARLGGQAGVGSLAHPARTGRNGTGAKANSRQPKLMQVTQLGGTGVYLQAAIDGLETSKKPLWRAWPTLLAQGA